MIHYTLAASLLAATIANAQQPNVRSMAREDSVLIAAVMHVIPRLPEGNVAVSPEYQILTGEPGNSSLVSVALSGVFLASVVGDEKHSVLFKQASTVRPDAATCSVAQRLSPNSSGRAHGECLLRGVNASVTIASYKIVDASGTVIVSIEENTPRGTSYGRAVQLTVERRAGRWIVTGERILVEQ